MLQTVDNECIASGGPPCDNPFDPTIWQQGGGDPRMFMAGGAGMPITVNPAVCGATRQPFCPTRHEPFCPTRQFICTQFGPNCQTMQIRCTQFGPNCESRFIRLCPTVEFTCTKFGPQCPTQGIPCQSLHGGGLCPSKGLPCPSLDTPCITRDASCESRGFCPSWVDACPTRFGCEVTQAGCEMTQVCGVSQAGCGPQTPDVFEPGGGGAVNFAARAGGGGGPDIGIGEISTAFGLRCNSALVFPCPSIHICVSQIGPVCPSQFQPCQTKDFPCVTRQAPCPSIRICPSQAAPFCPLPTRVCEFDPGAGGAGPEFARANIAPGGGFGAAAGIGGGAAASIFVRCMQTQIRCITMPPPAGTCVNTQPDVCQSIVGPCWTQSWQCPTRFCPSRLTLCPSVRIVECMPTRSGPCQSGIVPCHTAFGSCPTVGACPSAVDACPSQWGCDVTQNCGGWETPGGVGGGFNPGGGFGGGGMF